MKNKRVISFALLILSILLIQCTKKAESVASATEQTLIKNSWSVDYYFQDQDMTSSYSSSKLLFSSTGAVGYQKDGETIAGKWSRTVDGSKNETINLQFNSADANINRLNRSWQLVEMAQSFIQFEETDGASKTLFRLKTSN
jgi:hypothetical protein